MQNNIYNFSTTYRHIKILIKILMRGKRGLRLEMPLGHMRYNAQTDKFQLKSQ